MTDTEKVEAIRHELRVLGTDTETWTWQLLEEFVEKVDSIVDPEEE